MMTITDVVVKKIIHRLINGQDYRTEIVTLINAEFLQYVVDFFRKVVEAKLRNQTVTTDWYKSEFLNPNLPSDELIINSGLNKKTISNMYNSARREIVLEATTEHYEQLYEAINNLVEQGSDIDITLTIKLRGVSVDLNINESLIVINTLAVKRAELRGGAWSTAGKQVEKVLMVVLCKLYGVPENNYDFTGLSDAQDVAEMAQFGPYKLHSADLVQCPGCGTKVITGFSRTFVEHWQPGFNQYFDRAKQRG